MLPLIGAFLLTNLVTPAYAYPLPDPQPIQETIALPRNPLADNCYLYVASLVKLPHMDEILPNSIPTVGSVAVFYYPSTRLKHIALVTKLTDDGFDVREANYHHGEIDTRHVLWNDYALQGFWRDPDSG